MKKQIKDLTIWIEGTWCEAKNKDGEFIYEGSIEENMTHEDVYKILTARLEFRLNGKFLSGYTLYGTFPGERQAVLELLSQENNCKIEDIEVVKVVEEI